MAVAHGPEPAVRLGDFGYADWVIVALYGLREYLDRPYRRLLHVLHEMPDLVEGLGLSTTVHP